MFAFRRVLFKRIGRVYSLELIKRRNYYGMVTNVIWEQPKWIKRDSKPATMWQVFEVGLFDKLSASPDAIEFVRCTGYAPVSLSPGDNVEFYGPKEYNTKHKCEIVKIHDIDIDDNNEKDEELIEISKYAKGVSFKSLFILKQKFKEQLCDIIINEPELLEEIPNIGPKTVKKLQTAISKSCIEFVTNNDSCDKIQIVNKLQSETQRRIKRLKDKSYKDIIIKTDDEKNEWIQDWCDNYTDAVDIWFKQLIDNKLSLPMYCWNKQYAPNRKLIGKIENYTMDDNENGNDDDDINILQQQSQLFSKQLSTLNDSDQITVHNNIMYLMSAHDWMIEFECIWINRLYSKCIENKEFMDMMYILMNNMDEIACVDTEFFIGKYEYNHRSYGYEVADDLGIARLYNIGIATNNGKQISILIKHPTLSLQDRLNLFSSYRGQETMLNFLKPVLKHHIDAEGIEYDINIDNMDLNELDKYFNRYAIFPRAAWHIISNIIDKYPYLMYHFSHWDHKLIQLLATHCGSNLEIEKNEWFNTSKLCYALFPRNKVISHSLGYLSKRLCTDIDIQFAEHLGGADAMALMQLIKTLKKRFINSGIQMVRDDNNGSVYMKIDKNHNSNDAELIDDNNVNKEEDCKLYQWIVNKLELPQYYQLLYDQGFDDDISLIADLTDEDLLELAIQKKAHRVKILKEANKL